MTNSIEALDPGTREKVEKMMALVDAKRYELKQTWEYRIYSTVRTEDEQFAIWLASRATVEAVNVARRKAKMYPLGEKDAKRCVTECNGVDTPSMHQQKKAIDFVFLGPTGNPVWPVATDPRWLVLGEAGEAAGLTWGGRWRSPDCGHFEDRG